MLNNISTLHWIYIFIALGFSAAIIYTNIQRTALSRFFNGLLDKGADSKDTAKSLSELGIGGIYASICVSSSRKKHSAGKYVDIISDAASTGDNLEKLLDDKSSDKYYLTDYNNELLKKKYSYTPLSFPKLVLMIIALLAAIFITAKLTDFIIDEMRMSNVKFEESEKEEDTDTVEDNETEDKAKDDDSLDEIEEQENVNRPSTPTVPTGPSLPTGPKS